MKQGPFEQRYRPLWQELEQVIADPASAAARNSDLPALYRRLCNLLALAKSRHYSPALIDELNELALRGHYALYAQSSFGRHRIIHYLLAGFPRAVRAEWPAVALSALAFYGAGLLMFASVLLHPEMVLTVVDAGQVAQIESMYDPANVHLGRDGADSDALMFGFYLRNNTSIGLQTLAGGLLAGVGSLFFLVFNGVYFGAIAGHLTHVGLGNETFFPFVSGHSAMELTAIVLSGAAGLVLGAAIVAPGRLSRRHAIRQAARRAMTLAWGIMLMFLAAACIEAFWSASTVIPRSGKYLFGALQWALVIGYFVFMGRSRAT